MMRTCLSLSLLAPLVSALQIPLLAPSDRTQSIVVKPKHVIHHPDIGTLVRPSLHRAVPVSRDLPAFTLRTKRRRLLRPQARAGTPAYQAARRGVMRDRRGQLHPLDYEPMGWDEVEVDAPDVGDLETLTSLASMSGNAYWSPDEEEDGGKWYDIGGHFNLSSSFGWQDSGLRGHIFATPDNKTIVIAIKGTSAGGLVGGGGSTGPNDKKADNTFFSCCCARISWSWTTVCDCWESSYQCNQLCLEDAVSEESTYFPLATDLYNNVTRLWPSANVVLTGADPELLAWTLISGGHSLGGALSALLGLAFGVPVVTFESPGDLLPARRLHLPMPPGLPAEASAITHVYIDSDPIPFGACTGATSLCAIAGYALQSRCHSDRLGWSVDVRTHSISVTLKVLDLVRDDELMQRRRKRWPSLPWRRSRRNDHGGIGGVPEPAPEDDCQDCQTWTFV